MSISTKTCLSYLAFCILLPLSSYSKFHFDKPQKTPLRSIGIPFSNPFVYLTNITSHFEWNVIWDDEGNASLFARRSTFQNNDLVGHGATNFQIGLTKLSEELYAVLVDWSITSINGRTEAGTIIHGLIRRDTPNQLLGIDHLRNSGETNVYRESTLSHSSSSTHPKTIAKLEFPVVFAYWDGHTYHVIATMITVYLEIEDNTFGTRMYH